MMHRLRRTSPFQVILVVVFTALAAFMSLPIVFILNHAFKPQNELFLFPPRFFVQHPTFANFEALFLHAANATVPFTRYLFNSLVVAAMTLISVIVVSTMAAYVIAKYRFHFKQLIMAMITLSLMFAPETVSIPRYLIISGIGMNNTYFGHVLPALASPVAVFMLVGLYLANSERLDRSGQDRRCEPFRHLHPIWYCRSPFPLSRRSPFSRSKGYGGTWRRPLCSCRRRR